MKIEKTFSVEFYFLTTIACCAIIILLSLFSEISDLFYGIGSDGIYYYLYVPELIEQLKNKTFISELSGKLLPISIAHFFYSFFLKAGETVQNLPLGTCSISLSDRFVLTFRILNIAYLMLGVIIWSVICSRKKISNNLFLLSIGLLLFNFMFLKQFFFEPVFLDPFGFFYTTVLLYAVIIDKRWLQYCLIFCSFFINELAVVVTVLFVLPNSANTNASSLSFRRNKLMLVWSIAYLSMSVYLLFRPLCTEAEENQTMYNLSAISIAGALFYILFCWLKTLPEVIKVSVSKNAYNLFVIAAGILIHAAIVKLFTVRGNVLLCEGLDENAFNKVLSFVRQANSRPIGFLSSHFNYLGIIVLFLILYVSRIRSFLAIHPGWVPLFLCFSVVSINSESRYLTIFIPFLTWMLIAAPPDENEGLFKSKIMISGVCLLNLLWSGFYKSINPLGTENYFDCKDMIYSNLFISPLQKYFKHLGPWTSDESYYLQLGIFIGSLVAGFTALQFGKSGNFRIYR